MLVHVEHPRKRPVNPYMTIDEVSLEAPPTILVIEDDWVVREILYEILDSEGFNVLSFETADEAWAYLCGDPVAVSLIFSDIRLPGELSGVDLANLATRQWPNIPVILSSGFRGEYQLDSGCKPAFLPKPWHSYDIAIACRRALAAR